jgi:hypothetical protein
MGRNAVAGAATSVVLVGGGLGILLRRIRLLVGILNGLVWSFSAVLPWRAARRRLLALERETGAAGERNPCARPGHSVKKESVQVP